MPAPVFDQVPAVAAPLDPGFRPCTWAMVLVETARQVLQAEAPELAARITLYLPDETTRRVGQSIAAASLPRI